MGRRAKKGNIQITVQQILNLKMAIRLFIPFYIDKNHDRASEIMHCMKHNMLAGFDLITFVSENKEHADYIWNEADKWDDKVGIPIKTLISTHVTDKRQTFNDMLELMETHDDNGINIFCNSDIFFNRLDDIEQFIDNRPSPPKYMLALSRYDIQPNGQSILFDRPDSQDTWIFKGHPRFRTSIPIPFGVAGNDNRFAHEIVQSGYQILNPSKSIKTFHYHLTQIRNYVVNGQVTQRIPPPYHLVHPT